MRTMGSARDGGSDHGQGLGTMIGNRVMSELTENGVERSRERSVVRKEMESVGLVVNLSGNHADVAEGSGVGEAEEGDGGGREGFEELGKEEDEDQAEEGDGEAEEEGEEEDVVADAGRPKLDEGFYEIEAVRRKRVRKGVVQYLIKWRDWPETANTWEPIENLQSCSDVIEAFEERLSSGKGTQRRRKRKSGVIHAQIRRKQPRSAVSYNKRSGRVRNFVNSPGTSGPMNDTNFGENPSSSEYNINISAVDNKDSSDNVAVNSDTQLYQDNDLNMKLTEFRGGISNEDMRADNLGAHSQVDDGSQPQESATVNNTPQTPATVNNDPQPQEAARVTYDLPPQEATRVNNGSRSSQSREAARMNNGPRPREAARMHNGSQPQEAARVNNSSQPREAARVNNGSQPREAARVNNGSQPWEASRVNNGSQPWEAARVNNGLPSQEAAKVNNGLPLPPQEAARVNNVEAAPSNHSMTGSKKRKSGKVRRFIPDPDSHNRLDDVFDPVPGLEEAPIHEKSCLPSPASDHKIIEIIKPLSYAPPESNTVHDVVVTFLASRSDGKQVLVDNKFMKAYYPQQLITFYEKNLRYNPII